MASLKEIKDHIGSVKGTLKITSAMKMVASAKLRKAQQAIENMRPYQASLAKVLSNLGSASLDSGVADTQIKKVALVCLASNSSLCGGFNANAIRETKARIAAYEAEGYSVEVFSLGRKMAEAMKKAGYPSKQDYSVLVGKGEYSAAAEFAQNLVDSFLAGEFEKVELIYNHFVNNAVQKVLVEQYLPFKSESSQTSSSDDKFIIEPDKEALLEALVPKVIRLKLYTVILDSVAAEHAARTIAMQTATDNGEEILKQLTLDYNKFRQQKITAEILDIVGGSMN